MKWKLLTQETERTFVLVFDSGDEVVQTLRTFAEEQDLTAARFTAIGAFHEAMLGYFDFETKDYSKLPVDQQVEVLSLIGNIALKDAKPKVHAHVVVGRSDGTSLGGHLLSARVRPTLEVVLIESPVHLQRKHDEATGLALIDPNAESLPHRRGRPIKMEVESSN